MTYVLILTLGAMTFQLTPDTIVARIGPRVVRYSEISCNRFLTRGNLNRATQTQDEDCRRAEENQIHQIIGSELSAAAIKKYHLTLTAREEADAIPAKYRNDKYVRQITELNRSQARAALRVLHGEDRQRVFDEELSEQALKQKGITEIHFPVTSMEPILQLFPTVEDAEHALAQFTEEKTKGKLTETFIQEALGLKIRALIEERASTRGVSFAEAKTQFWLDLANEVKVEITSPRYQPPPFLRGAK